MKQDVISMSRLGQMGRFGNQLVQYVFLKTYARLHNLEVQTPDWVGKALFGCDDRPITAKLPEFRELYDKDPERMVIPMLARPLRNVDAAGYFQYHSSYYRPFQAYIRKLLRPVDAIREPLDAAVQQLRSEGAALVALHLRRGDYGYSYFYRTPTAWYLQWLEQIWPTLPNPVLFLATDDASVTADFQKYSPTTAADLGLSLPAAPYYPDFYLLSQADYLAIPNSTFSFVAAMLNENLKEAYRSHLSDPLEDPPFRRIDPWNADMLDISAVAENYPQLPELVRPPKSKLRLPRWLRPLLSRKRAG